MDPIREGWNWYVYCGNDPVNFTDPWGLIAESVWDGISLGLGIVSLANNISKGDVRGAVVDSVGILADAAALAMPFIPGGAGAARKTARTAALVGDIFSASDSDVSAVQEAPSGDVPRSVLYAASAATIGTEKLAGNAAGAANDDDKAARNSATTEQIISWVKEESKQQAISTTLHLYDVAVDATVRGDDLLKGH